MIIKIILFILMWVLLIWALFLTFRNNKTHTFLLFYINASFKVVEDFLTSLCDDQELLDRSEEYNGLKRMCSQIINKYSYEQILFSLKPFKLESWFTPEEVEFIKRGIR